MSLFEWLGEIRNPGPIGGVDAETPEPVDLPADLLVLRGAIGLAVLGALVFAAFTAESRWLGLCLLASYLLVAHLLRPRPDGRNLGWAWGLIDHPLRWSDDMNRLLFWLRVVLWPGRFGVAAVRDVLKLPWRSVSRWSR